jgi:small ligand-binding sensory domain FIST
MKAFRAAHAAAADWLQAANNCLRALGDVPGTSNLGFLYVTDAFAPQLAQVLGLLRRQTGVSNWVGSVGTGVCGNGREYHEQGAISVLLGAFREDSFQVFPPLREEIAELAESAHPWAQAHEARFGIVHGDPQNPRVAELVQDLTEALEGGFLVGGLTSSRGPHWQIANEVTSGGLSGVLFAPEVGVTTALTQGCTPLGPHHEITECQGNVIARIDDRPALEVLNEDIGALLARDLSRAAGYIFAARPIRGSDTGDYLVRNLLGVDTRNGLIAIGDYVSAGDPIMFCRRDSRTAREDLLRMLRDIRSRAGAPPRGAVYYSCLGRGQHMFGTNSEELKMIRQELGELPLAGFFCSGEISHNRLYGYTGVLTLFL